MQDPLLDVLSGETLVHANALATVTRNCLVVRNEHKQAVIGIQAVREMRKQKFTNSNLLVIAAGIFTIAAAAYASHSGYEVSIALAIIGCAFVAAYFSTRRASIVFLLDDQAIESGKGTYREATSTMRAVNRILEGDQTANLDFDFSS